MTLISEILLFYFQSFFRLTTEEDQLEFLNTYIEVYGDGCL
jgi:hypothetical protein